MLKTSLKQKPPKIAVLKFSGSLLSKKEEPQQVIHEIYQYLRRGFRVLAVVSAFDDHNHQLSQSGINNFVDDGFIPPAPELAELLASDETAVACLLTIGLDRAGIKAKKLHHQCLLTKNSLLNSDPESFTSDLVISLFERYSVLVLPGAIGYDQTKTTTLLGRKGADYTAIYAAWTLHAQECVIYKETDVIYEKANKDTIVHQYEYLNYGDLLKRSSVPIHHGAVKFAEFHHMAFSIKSLLNNHKTTIHDKPSTFLALKQPHRPLNVALLGLGTVGFGVYQYLLTNSQLFNIVGIGVQDFNKHQREQISADLVSIHWQEILARNVEILIDVTGNSDCSETIIRQALEQGNHVITANRSLIAEKGEELQQLALLHNVHLLYSATVGGAIPIIEHLQNLNETDSVQSITAILNSTCNFILDKVKEGQTLSHTLSLAKIVSLEESEPTLDLYGNDAKQKAIILSRIAFGRDPDIVDCVGIQYLDELKIRAAELHHQNIRLVVCCTLENHIIHVKIEPAAIDANHPLAHVTGIQNAVLIRTRGNETIELHGKGTGRWPIAESVFADLLDLSNRLNLPKQDVNQTVHTTLIHSELHSELLPEKEAV